MRVLLGIGGGIAAYKAAELVRLFRQREDAVQVVMTQAARQFAAARTLAALSGQPVLTSLFRGGAEIEHIAVAHAADVAVVAPATAHLLARMAHGLADDYLTTVLLATPAPVLVAPAMNVQMWRHPATQANLELLRQRGVGLIPPGEGYLACGMVGEGRMAEPAEIVAAVLERLRTAVPATLRGEHVLVTAGPTREALDPIRFLSNRSSGRMGYALAEAARQRGASVTLVSGPTALTPPAGVKFVAVTTAEEMLEAARAAFPGCSIALLAAAVADFRPATPAAAKIKKAAAASSLALEPTPDILAQLGRLKQHQLLVGFAAETDPAQALAFARAKREAKHCDLVVLNLVHRAEVGFDVADNEVTLVGSGGEQALPRAPKTTIAGQILDAVAQLPRHALHPA
ncbi:MAG: bifunctional phosphopantothenoylcysteine decarboxylase/phosphopantothenate--cysteine ligase CoaBC [Terriglobales bacterium]